jgi:hypothetical protein
MLKKTMIAGFAALALVTAHGARAAGPDDGGFSETHFSDSASAGLQDPISAGASASDVAAATAAASIEPAAGAAENVFTTTQVGNASSGPAQPTAPPAGADVDAGTIMSVYP